MSGNTGPLRSTSHKPQVAPLLQGVRTLMPKLPLTRVSLRHTDIWNSCHLLGSRKGRRGRPANSVLLACCPGCCHLFSLRCEFKLSILQLHSSIFQEMGCTTFQLPCQTLNTLHVSILAHFGGTPSPEPCHSASPSPWTRTLNLCAPFALVVPSRLFRSGNGLDITPTVTILVEAAKSSRHDG